MSAGLVSHKKDRHDFQDDLESTLWVLLWMTLMFSQVSNPDVMPTFLSNILNPWPYLNNGGTGKMEFLIGCRFLSMVQFPERNELHKLISNLTFLFAVLYEDEPPEAGKEISSLLNGLDQKDPNDEHGDMLRRRHVFEYDTRINALQDYSATIKLFQDALKDRTKWPSNDVAVLQTFGDRPPSHLVVKSGWCTGLYLQSVQPASGDGGVTQSGDEIMGTG